MLMDHRAANDNGAKQVGFGVADDGQLRPATTGELIVALAVNVVGAGVSALKAGGVNSAFGTFVYETEGAGPLEDGTEQWLKSPFFSRRFSA